MVRVGLSSEDKEDETEWAIPESFLVGTGKAKQRKVTCQLFLTIITVTGLVLIEVDSEAGFNM